MPQLSLKAFAALAKSMPGAADEEIIAAAKQAGGEVIQNIVPAVKRGVREILESGEDYGILSAGNPMGKALSEQDNLVRHSSMLEKLKGMGLEPLEQRGVYGGTEEPSFFVPGLNAEQTAALGREFEQEAVISAKGWHRLADDATFPRTSVNFDQDATNFYSELVDPISGQPMKFQLGFPDEAFGLPASPISVPKELPAGGRMELPPVQGSTMGKKAELTQLRDMLTEAGLSTAVVSAAVKAASAEQGGTVSAFKRTDPSKTSKAKKAAPMNARVKKPAA